MTPPLPPHIQAIKERHEAVKQKLISRFYADLPLEQQISWLTEIAANACAHREYLLSEYEKLQDASIDAVSVIETLAGKLQQALNPTGGEELGEGVGS